MLDNQNKIYDLLKASGFNCMLISKTANNFDVIKLDKDKVINIVLFLKNNTDLLFDMLFSVSGMDYGDEFGVVYHLYSTKNKTNLILKTTLSKQNPQLQSLSGIYNAANWHEREVFDLFGISFLNHPNLKRILLPENWFGHPLRKDYVMADKRLSWNER